MTPLKGSQGVTAHWLRIIALIQLPLGEERVTLMDINYTTLSSSIYACCLIYKFGFSTFPLYANGKGSIFVFKVASLGFMLNLGISRWLCSLIWAQFLSHFNPVWVHAISFCHLFICSSRGRMTPSTTGSFALCKHFRVLKNYKAQIILCHLQKQIRLVF